MWPFKRGKKQQTRTYNVRHRRGYSAAGTGRLLSSWGTQSLTADGELKQKLSIIRARSRDLAMNNDYARKFLKMCVMNVVGPRGIVLQVKAKSSKGLDTEGNKTIERLFKEWGRRGTATVCGRYSWEGVQRLVMECVPRDGEIVIRKVKGREAGNRFNYGLWIVEGDHIDESYNAELANGNIISMGVEYNKYGRPIAYHLLKRHPGEYSHYIRVRGERERVLADDLYHVFIPERVKQNRGVPWMHTAMTRLNMIGGYEEAEVVAARASASKMGFLTTPSGDDYTGDDTDTDGNTITEFEPGLIEQLPEGWDFKAFDPDHPSGNYQPFMKTTLRGVASGLVVSYNSLSSDLEGVNYSSIRSGVLEERDYWKIVQNWFIETLCTPVYRDWLGMSFTSPGVIPFPEERYDKFANAAGWQTRGWPWVDPLKDEKANTEALVNGTKTRTEILAERGLDLEDTFDLIAYEEKLAEDKGISIGGPKKKEGDDDGRKIT